MLDDIRLAIEKNLPAEISRTLQQVLKKGEEDATKLKERQTLIDSLLNERDELKKLKINQDGLDLRQKALAEEVRRLENKEWELKVKEAELKGLEKSYQMNQETVKAVFSNNKFKYYEHGHMPVSTPPGYSNLTGSFSKTTELEG